MYLLDVLPQFIFILRISIEVRLDSSPQLLGVVVDELVVVLDAELLIELQNLLLVLVQELLQLPKLLRVLFEVVAGLLLELIHSFRPQLADYLIDFLAVWLFSRKFLLQQFAVQGQRSIIGLKALILCDLLPC